MTSIWKNKPVGYKESWDKEEMLIILLIETQEKEERIVRRASKGEKITLNGDWKFWRSTLTLQIK